MALSNFKLIFFSLHRNDGPDVGAKQPGEPLPEFARSVHQLHLRGRQSRADLAPGRESGSELSATHQGGHRIRSHLTGRRHQDRFAVASGKKRRVILFNLLVFINCFI